MGKKNKKKKKSIGDGVPVDDDPPPAPPLEEPRAAPPAPAFDAEAVRSEFRSILRKYPEKQLPWYLRSLEKNLGIKKRSLDAVGEAVMAAMYAELDGELSREEAAADADAEASARAVTEVAAPPGERAAAPTVDGACTVDTPGDGAPPGGAGGADVVGADGVGADGDGAAAATASALGIGGRLLLSLRPHVDARTPYGLLCRLCYFLLLTLFCSSATCAAAEHTWRRDVLPALVEEKRVVAAGLAQNRARVDAERVEGGTHLWSGEAGGWIEREAVYTAAAPPSALPAGVRCTGGRWERWAKNLTTKLGKKKLQALREEGGDTRLTKGAWTIVRPGEGWASAPSELESPHDSLTDAHVRLYGCTDKNEVFECTTYAKRNQSLPSVESIRELELVDSGRCIFQFSESTKKGWIGSTVRQYAEYARCGADGAAATAAPKKAGKEKKSRSEKRAQKRSYEH